MITYSSNKREKRINMIKIYNSAHMNEKGVHARYIELEEVNIRVNKIGTNGVPYILFEHEDYPLGALRATYNGSYWECDLD